MNEGLIVDPELERLIQQNQNDYNALLHESIMESTAELDLKEQELALIRKSIEDYRTKRELEEQRLQLLEKAIDECSKSLKSKEKQLDSFLRELNFCCRDVDDKEREYNAIQRSIEEKSMELEAKEDQLKSVEKEIYECERVLRLKKEECNWQREMKYHLISEHEEVHEKMKREIEEYENDFEDKKARLCSINDLISEHEKELKEKDFELGNIHRDVELKKEELSDFSKKIAECNKEVKAKECDLRAMQRLIDGKGKEFEFKRKNLLTSMKVKINQHAQHARELELKKKEFDSLIGSMEERNLKLDKKEKYLGERAKVLDLRKKQLDEQVNEFESKEKQLEGQVRDLKSKQVHFEGRVKEFESERDEFNVREKELESNKNRYKEMVGVIESTEKLLGEHMKDYDSRQQHFEVQLKEFDSKEKKFEEQMKDLEFKKDQYEEQVKELELKEAQFKVQVKELELKEVQFKLQLKELESQKKQFKSLEKEKVLKEKSSIILHQAKTEQLYFTNGNSVENSKKLELLFNLVKKYELICCQVSEAIQTSADPTKLVLDAIKGFCPPQLVEGEVNSLRRIFNLLMDEFKKSLPVISFRVKQEAVKLATNWKVNLEAAADMDYLEVLDFFRFIATYEIGSCFNENELQRLLHIIAQRCKAPQVHDHIEKLPYKKLSLPPTDGGNHQLLSNESQLIDKDTLVNLQTSPDPAQLVLDMIQKPNESIVIDENHIVLLEQLMEISPDIKPQVREEAMKLALYLKENMRGSTENSLVVLGFLLLLSNYGLVSYFNEDEVLKLLEFAAQHKLAVNLFRTLGLVDKIYDFVQNLVTKKQHIEAVRFICAYKLADKIQPVNLLQQYMERLKQMSERYGNKKSTETKVRAIDKEIGSLGTILQCISDNKLEPQDLVNEIKDRILFLQKEKEDIVREALESYSKVEMQQPGEQRPANEVVTKNQMQQLEENKCAIEAVSENNVEVQQLDKKKRYNGANTMNQDKVEQCKSKKCINEAITMNPVQHPQEKKRVIDAVSSNHHFNQTGNYNKRSRAALTDYVPPVFPSYYEYQGGFIPREMPPQFWFPTNYFGSPLGAEQVEDRGTNYSYHFGPRLPNR